MEIPESFLPLMTSGVSLLLGSRDAALRPATQRLAGALISPDRKLVTVYVPVATGERTLANLRAVPRAAVTFSRVIDCRSVQIKGPVLAIRPARDDERGELERYLPLFFRALEEVGMPYAVTSRLTTWPCTAVEVGVEEFFDQTPGPTAGRALDEGARG